MMDVVFSSAPFIKAMETPFSIRDVMQQFIFNVHGIC